MPEFSVPGASDALAIEITDAEQGDSLRAPSRREYLSRGYAVSHAQLDDGASYHTILCGKPWLQDVGERRRCQSVLYDVLKHYFSRAGLRLQTGKVLFCGLGNAGITADALGPMICRRLRVVGGDESPPTAEPTLYAISPGVPAQSGIGTGERLRILAERLRVDLILTADAVAARTVRRLASVIQVSDYGVKAGSGIGLHSDEISGKTMPCPVISIGVPTVIRASVLIGDALRAHGVPSVWSAEEEFLVSNSEIDVICECYANLIGGAVNRIFSPATTVAASYENL